MKLEAPSLVLATLLFMSPDLPARTIEHQVIPPGREARVMALFAGLQARLGERAQAGGISIDKSEIKISLLRPGSTEPVAHIICAPLAGATEGDAKSASFAIRTKVVEASEASTAAIAAVVEVIQANDRGGFYITVTEKQRDPGAGPGPTAGAPEHEQSGPGSSSTLLWLALGGVAIFGVWLGLGDRKSTDT